MFESFYGMTHQPFAATPNPACCAAVKSMKNAYDALNQCLVSGQGIGILTSFSGMGKSLLCQTLADSLSENYHSIYLPNSNYKSSRDLLQSILCHLDKPFKKLSVQELRLDIERGLQMILKRKQNGAILFIEEAEKLDTEILEEIRTLSNLTHQGNPLIRIVLSGQMELEEKLISPALSGLHQRIGCHVSLEKLSRQETVEYIELRIQWAGGKIEEVFTPSAIEFITQVSDGNPRCINAICEHSLTHGAQIGEKPIDMNAVMLAFEQLKQLPLRWNEPQVAVSEKNHAQKANLSSESDSELIQDNRTCQGVEIQEESSCIEIGCEPEISEIDNSGMVSFEVGADDLIESDSRVVNQSNSGRSEVFETGTKSDTNEPERSTMNEKQEKTEADYCVPDGDGWAVFNPKTKRNPVEIIEQLENAISSLSSNNNNEPENTVIVDSREEVPSFEAPKPGKFEEEFVVDTYAALDAQSARREGITVNTESVNSETDEEEDRKTISIQSEKNRKLSGSSIKERQTNRLDPEEIRQAMRQDRFDVILPENGSQNGSPSAQLNQPNFIGKKSNRQEI